MADEIQLKVSADIKEVNSAITATKKFEKQHIFYYLNLMQLQN